MTMKASNAAEIERNPKYPKLYTSCLDSCDTVSHGVYSFEFFVFFDFLDLLYFFFVSFGFLRCFFDFIYGALSKESQNIVFVYCFFCIFHVFFWISLILLTCILKKRAFRV